jgi:hypothetical protein
MTSVELPILLAIASLVLLAGLAGLVLPVLPGSGLIFLALPLLAIAVVVRGIQSKLSR